MAGVCGSGIPDDNRFGYDAISASGTGRTMGLPWSRDRAPGRRRNGTSMRSWRKERFM